MKRILTTLAAVLLVAAAAFASPSDLLRTPGGFMNQTAVQTFTPDGAASVLLTVNQTVLSLTGKLLYGVYTPTGTTCKMRNVPAANSTLGNYIGSTVPVTTWVYRGVNPSTPYLNLSGCTAGTVQIQ